MGEKLFSIGELGDRDLSASGGYLHTHVRRATTSPPSKQDCRMESHGLRVCSGKQA